MDAARPQPQPSTCTNDCWIKAWGPEPTGEDEQMEIDPGKVGKWMIFVPRAGIDAAWSTVREALLQNRLGFAAKVSTALLSMQKDASWGRLGLKHVIIVYTHDYEDRDDVMRVRTALRELGFTQKMGYKTDNATRAGVYRVNSGGRPVSIYWE